MITLKVVNLHATDCDVRVDRQTKYGNPFRMQGGEQGRPECLRQFGNYARRQRERMDALAQDIRDAAARLKLGAVRLGCWCHPRACHAGVWIELLCLRWPEVFRNGLIDEAVDETGKK